MSLPRDTTNCWMTGRDREKLRDDVRVEQEVENPSSENKVHYVQKANRSTSNHNILAAHLYPVGEFRDAAGGVVPGELLQLGHECRIVLNLRSRLVQDRPSAEAYQIISPAQRALKKSVT